MMAVAKSLKVTTFPTIIIFRGGVELERIHDTEKIVERIILSLNSVVTHDDKMSHSKRRHRLTLEKSLGLENSDPTEEVDDGPEHVSWHWDSEQCSDEVQIKALGMVAAVIEDADEGEKYEWEYQQGKMWISFSPSTVLAIEKEYRAGNIYNGAAKLPGVKLECTTVKLSMYEITGFMGVLDEKNVCVPVRRKGLRYPVVGEEPFLTKEQKERDLHFMVWKEKVEEYKKEILEKRMGNDVHAIRGTVGMLPNTGIHSWTLRWNHEPVEEGRGGKGSGARVGA
jgi:hypothetical protein